MILNEFELDLLYEYDEKAILRLAEKNNITFEEARKQNYNQNFKKIRVAFSHQTRCITSMYSRLFPSFSNPKIRKIIVTCCKNKEKSNHLTIIDGVAEITQYYDYVNFFELDEYSQKKMALEILMSGIVFIVNSLQFVNKEFINTYKMIVEQDYLNVWNWCAKWNQKHTYNAIVRCEHNVQQISIYLEIHDKMKETIANECIVMCRPDEWCYSQYLGRLIWLNENEVALFSKNKQIVASYAIKR